MTTDQIGARDAGPLERRELLPQVTVAVRLRLGFADLAAAFPEHLPRIAAQVNELGGTISGPPYARYLEMGGETIELEMGVPVGAPMAGVRPMAEAEDMEVAQSELPGGPAAVLVHTGPYDELRRSWESLDGLLAEAGLRPTGPAWESYVDDPDDVPAETLRTEIVLPLG